MSVDTDVTAAKTPGKAGKGASWLRPSVILPVVILIMVVSVMFGPRSQVSDDTRLTTYSANASGVQGIYDVLRELDYPVERRLRSMSDSVGSNAIYVLFSTPVPLSDTEINQLLTAVRNGAGLIFAWEPRLTDSLGFSLTSNFSFGATLFQTRAAGGEADVPLKNRSLIPLPVTETVSRQEEWNEKHREKAPEYATFFWFTPLENRKDWRDKDSTKYPAIIMGSEFGKGRTVIVSDPEILRNFFAKDGRPIFAIVRAIDWINAERTNRLPVVFDEYHQGFGVHADVSKAVRTALTETPLGRTTMQLCIAALVLLIALGARAIAPSARTVITRRSPIEHVSALAHAYEQTGAKQLATDRLIRGLRRRHPFGTPRSQSNETYLDRIAAHIPATQTDTEMLRTLLHPQSDGPVVTAKTVGTTIARIETLMTTRL